VADNLPAAVSDKSSSENPIIGFNLDEDSFHWAIKLFVKKVIGQDTTQPTIHLMVPGGDHHIMWDLLMPPCKMLCIAKQLPAGKMSKPSEKLNGQWYYMTYHHADHAEYVKSKKTLAVETIESLTNYFQAIFSQKKLMALLKVPRWIGCTIVINSTLQTMFARSAMRLPYKKRHRHQIQLKNHRMVR
jgi:hypothetical protein